MLVNSYDYIILGSGVSGLCLADALTRQFASCSVLLIDPDCDPDYNISFWWEGEPPFPDIMTQKWHKIKTKRGTQERICPLTRYHLYAFWRSKFDACLHERLQKTGRVNFFEASVSQFSEHDDYVEVITPQQHFRGAWVFDSRTQQRNVAGNSDSKSLTMSGLAWEVSTENAVFDSSTATLFDFMQETDRFDFFYVLPYSPQTALVNYAVLTPFSEAISPEICTGILDRYLTQQQMTGEYEIKKSCYGRIPLSSRAVKRQTKGRVMNIGARGGMIKSSTSYAFTRILEDTQKIVESLNQTGTPFYPNTHPWYYHFADQRMVNMFQEYPDLAQQVMNLETYLYLFLTKKIH
jgi:lycopene beta-cyclase